MKSIQADKSSAFRTVGFLIFLFASSSVFAATLTVNSTSNDPTTIGTNVSSGCIRLTNEDVVDLYNRTPVGTKVIVLPTATTTPTASAQ